MRAAKSSISNGGGWFRANTGWVITIITLLLATGMTWGTVYTRAQAHYDNGAVHHTTEQLDERYALDRDVVAARADLKEIKETLNAMNLRLERLSAAMGVD